MLGSQVACTSLNFSHTFSFVRGFCGCQTFTCPGFSSKPGSLSSSLKGSSFLTLLLDILIFSLLFLSPSSLFPREVEDVENDEESIEEEDEGERKHRRGAGSGNAGAVQSSTSSSSRSSSQSSSLPVFADLSSKMSLL